MANRVTEAIKENKLWSGFFGVLVAAGVALWVGFYNHPAEADTEGHVAPSVSIDDFEWIGTDGRYKVSGTVRDLEPGQMLWTYNQKHEKDDYDTVGPIYPDAGPCPVSANGTFGCALGYAGNSSISSGVTYTVYIAVVTPEQAYESAKVKANYEALTPFSSVASIPHVAGESTVDSIDRLHPS